VGNTFLASATAMIVFAGGLFIALERPSWVPLLGAKPEPVLVFLVGDRRGVEVMRRAVDPARIVAESPDAIALVEGRMVATTPEAVSAPLMQAGWQDREIELLKVPRNDGLRRPSRGGTAGDDPRMAKLVELMNKPELSQGGALFVLQAMNDGLM